MDLLEEHMDRFCKNDNDREIYKNILITYIG